MEPITTIHQISTNTKTNKMICTNCKLKFEQINSFRPYDINEIIKRTCEFLKISYEDLIKKNRRRELVEKRMILVHIIYSNPGLGLTLLEVSNIIGKKDHTSALHLFNKAKTYKDIYPEFNSYLHAAHMHVYGTDDFSIN